MNLTAKAKSDGSIALTGKQGSTWSLLVSLYTDAERTTPMDLTGYSARAQIRQRYSSTDIAAAWNCAVDVSGKVTLTLDAETTATLDARTPYVTDVEIFERVSGIVTRILEGTLTIDPEVTR